jgi:hypothetical protein
MGFVEVLLFCAKSPVLVSVILICKFLIFEQSIRPDHFDKSLQKNKKSLVHVKQNFNFVKK